MQPYTQTPNSIYAAMPDMGEAELRIVLVVVRMTHGWHRSAALISLSYFERATGLSRHGVLAGIRAALSNGHIRRERSGSSYSYAIVDNSDSAAADYPQAETPHAPPPGVQPAHPKKKPDVRDEQLEEMLITISSAAAETGERPLESVGWLAKRARGLGMGDGDLWCLWQSCQQARRPLGLLLWALGHDGRVMRGKTQGRAGKRRSGAHSVFYEVMRS